jgi:hypothetical protein
MGFRFRKSVRLMPGVRINISKSGTSLSLGGRGLTHNISRRGNRTTVGIPRTGLSYSSNTGKFKRRGSQNPLSFLTAIFWLFIVCLIIGALSS